PAAGGIRGAGGAGAVAGLQEGGERPVRALQLSRRRNGQGLMPGCFLSLDGLDGTAKSTQCRLLAAWLRSKGHTVTTCADPGGTAAGDVIRALLLEHRGELTVPAGAALIMARRGPMAAEVAAAALAGAGAGG